VYVDEIRYKARFHGGPLHGHEKVYIAQGGVMLDKVGEPCPTQHGFTCVEYARDGLPDSEGVVAYRWQNYDRVEVLLTPGERAAIRAHIEGGGCDGVVKGVLDRLLRNSAV
jgi:hypothetical protein